MSIRWKPERDSWAKPCKNCGDVSEVGEEYCPACLRDRAASEGREAASHAERGQSS